MIKRLTYQWLRPYLLFGALGLLLLSTETVLAQKSTYVIKGQISDDNGGVPGATVQIEGTGSGTISDIEGNYTLNLNLAQGKYVLSFASMGYTSVKEYLELSSKTELEIDVKLRSDIMNLDEVVVTGSTVKESRRQLGNAISSIKSEALEKSGSSNLLSSLQGKIPGAQITQNSGDPAGGISIRLRGVKSIQGSSDPLYVIDGVIVSNNTVNVSQTAVQNQIGTTAQAGTNRLADINPADIESINVVNGAAAAAQYGSRAANGVVIITTKRGKSGVPRIQFTTNISVNELRKKVPITTYGKQFGYAGLRLHTIFNVSDATAAANGATTIGVNRNGEANTYLASNLVDVTRYDYQDQIFRTGAGTTNSLSVSGGTDKTQYLLSVNYAKNQGIVVGTDFQRYGLRARVDQRITEWMKVSAGVSYTNSFSNEKANGNVFYSPINSINITNNIWDITQRDANGDLMAVEPTRVNPLTTVEDMKFTAAVNRTINDLQLNLTPAKGFTIDAILGMDAYSQVGKNFIPPYPYQAVSGLPLERYPYGFASTVTNTANFFNADLNIGYERQWNEVLKMNLLAGASYQYSSANLLRGSGETLSPFIETLNGGSTIQAGYGLDQYNLSGQFVQATLGYKNLAFLTGAVRRDRSSKFSSSETNQVYPKISGSLVLSDLAAWQGSGLSQVVNTFKLRASLGQAGNLTGIGSYDRFWQFNPISYLGLNTIVPSAQLANPSVRPERMKEQEFGMDASFLKDKISLTFSAYKQNITDLVVNKVIAASTGGTSIVNNTGEMSNHGVEIGVNVTPIQSKDFTWDFSVMFNRNRNKILSLGTPMVTVNNVAGAPISLIEGQAASLFYGVPYARNENGDQILNSQGFPQREQGTQNGADYTAMRTAEGQPTGGFVNGIIGNPNPDWTGSFSSQLNYKRLGFRFLLDAVQGVDVFNADFRTRQGVGIGEVAEAELKGELKRGYTFANYLIEEWRIDDGSYIKLREIALTYQLPKIKGINSANLSLIGRNLYSWDKYRGYDPETNAGGNSDLMRGVDFGNVPIPRSYQLQLTLSF
ncbi:TonB-linked SusC/RagA family outer membrane protein [Dyadobacter jejuensis]|uniref:TonB-linked SusC/RagA family outer membrane protein n=1 Tax=Dyadobacter jejuensis TaxID=1082580 RepID=A0A316AJ81_9BACT|nr:SusC/RagA family TonB-linked outer membrane protein [Dyadobacter jejuensis]PWJ56930.1 TonB-linked SusC/RagA family outer membrane protein [Dyadobacter jejuensis]